jgi:hypothetical protein
MSLLARGSVSKVISPKRTSGKNASKMPSLAWLKVVQGESVLSNG